MPSRPPRILVNALLLRGHLGGIGNYGYHLLQGLLAARPDWKIAVLVHGDMAPRFRPLGPRLEILEVNLGSTAARHAYLHLVLPWRLLLRRRFDLVHSIGNMGLAFCPVPQVVSIMDTYEQVSPERFGRAKRTLMALLIARSGRKAARILAISENTRKDVARFYPHLAGKTRVVYLGNKFPSLPAARYADRAGFVFVGTLEPGKNLPLTLEAFARARGAKGHRLKVIGAMGWNQSHIPALLDRLGIRDRVDFLGYVPDPDLRALYAGSVALIQASNYEGFGLPVIEAMACGCPAIVARNSALVEAGGDAALFFASGDAAALADCLDRLLAHPELGEECVRKGLLHAARFTWERTASETAGVYASVLRRPSNAGGAVGSALDF